jgi:hypothetical protein
VSPGYSWRLACHQQNHQRRSSPRGRVRRSYQPIKKGQAFGWVNFDNLDWSDFD